MSVPAAWRARVVMVALFALFVIPLLVAYGLNVLAPHWLPFGQINRGQLVEPPLMAALEAVRPVEGRRPGPGARAPWVLVHVSASPCERPCQQALVSIRQARLALGKDAGRVDRWWLVTGEVDPRAVVSVKQLDPGLHVGVVPADSPLARSGASAPVQLVDPAGYLILRYLEADSASDVLKDLQRLLKISGQG